MSSRFERAAARSARPQVRWLRWGGAVAVAAALTFGVAAPASAVQGAEAKSVVAAAPSIRPLFVDVAWDYYNPNCAWKKLHTRYGVTGMQYTVHNYLGSGKFRSNSYIWQATVGYLQYSSRITTCK